MDVWQAIERRSSIREYDVDRDVTEGDLVRILEAAIRAPSAGNLQPWRFFVVRDRQIKLALARAAADQEFVAQAPVAVVVCAEPQRSARRYGTRGSDFYCLLDCAAATENLLLAATGLGLGACWVGAFSESGVRSALMLPSTLRPVAIVPIGWPRAEPEERTSRRSLDRVVESR